MEHRVEITPYGERENGESIDDFNDEELDLITDTFQRLCSKCKESFKNLKKVSVKRNQDTIVINYKLKKEENLSDEDFLFYLESLTGHNSDNIIRFGDVDYIIRGKPVFSEEDSDEDLEENDFLSKMMKIQKQMKS